jgi:hypothetical protein
MAGTQIPAPLPAMTETYGTAAYWREKHGKLHADYMDMQRVLAAIIDQNGGEITVHPWTLAELPRLTWIHVMKTEGGGMRVAVTKVPDGTDKTGTDREPPRSVGGR